MNITLYSGSRAASVAPRKLLQRRSSLQGVPPLVGTCLAPPCLAGHTVWARKRISNAVLLIFVSSTAANAEASIDQLACAGGCLQTASVPVMNGNQRRTATTSALSSPIRALAVPGPVFPDFAEGLEAPVQLAYLAFLLVILSGAAYVVVKQVLNRREMDERSKVLGELIRKGDAVSEDYFELGVVLARKRLFTQALKNYTKAVKLWDGEEVELAQVLSLWRRSCNLLCLWRMEYWAQSCHVCHYPPSLRHMARLQ